MLTRQVALLGRGTPVPLQLPGLLDWVRSGVALYQDAARTTPALATTNPVGGWGDQSGLAHHLSQATSGLRGQYRIGTSQFDPPSWVALDGLDDYLQSAAYTIGSTADLFLATRLRTFTLLGSQDIVFDLGDTTSTVLAVGSEPLSRLNSGANLDYVGTLSQGEWRIIRVHVAGASSAIYENGVLRASGNAGTRTLGKLTMGALRDGTRTFAMDLAEACLYSPALSAADATRLEAYLTAAHIRSGVYAGAHCIKITSQDKIDLGNIYQYERTQPWTIMAAVRLIAHQPTASLILGNVSTSPFPGYELWIDSAGKLRVRIMHDIPSDALGVIGSQDLLDGTWHMVGATYDGSSTAAGVKLYVDGVLDTGKTVEVDTLASTIIGTNQMFVGNQVNHLDYFFNGYLDAVSLHDIARDATYMAAHTTPSTIPTDDGHCVLILNLDTGTGLTATDTGSGGHNGTLSAGVIWV